jgi:hypothetical protein
MRAIVYKSVPCNDDIVLDLRQGVQAIARLISLPFFQKQ